MRREILIDSVTAETRIALLEDEVLTEIFIERPSHRGLTGSVFKGRVSNILPGMQAAFVDIGTGRDAFLYVQDLESRVDDEESPGPAAESDRERGDPPAPVRIEDLLKEGQEVVVQ